MRLRRLSPGLELAGLGCSACAAWVVVFVAGRTALPSPPIGNPTSWVGWYNEVGPVIAVFSLCRLVLLGALAVWALAAFGLASAGLGRPGRRLAATAVRTLSLVRLPGSATMVGLAVGLSVSAATLGACGVANQRATASPPAPVLFNPSKEPAGTSAPMAPRASRGAESPRLSTAPTPTPPEVHATRPAASTRPATVGASTAGVSTASGLWVVRPGDDLWSIAADTLRLRLGRQPDRREIAVYWMQVIAANRTTLTHPDDPSLIYPGDLIILPAD